VLTVVKTLAATELPPGWQLELGARDDQLVEVRMEALPQQLDPQVTSRLLLQLQTLIPVKIEADMTEFIRNERDIDETTKR
jgi:hypothetical protein